METKCRTFREEQKKSKQTELSQNVVPDSQQADHELSNVALAANECMPASCATSRDICTNIETELPLGIDASRTKFIDTTGPLSTANTGNTHVENTSTRASNAAATVPDFFPNSSNLDLIGLDLSSTREEGEDAVNEVNDEFRNDEDDENNVDIPQSEFQVRTIRGGMRQIQGNRRGLTSQTYEESNGQDEIERTDVGGNVHYQPTRDV